MIAVIYLAAVTTGMDPFQIDFEPLGRRGQCPKDRSLLECARRLGIGIISVCGGQGECYRCKVQIIEGAVSKPTSLERKVFSTPELKKGWRLACQTYPAGACQLKMPLESMATQQRTQFEGLQVIISPEPAVRAYKVKLTAPAGFDLQADADRLVTALNQQYKLSCCSIDFNVLREISPCLRSWDWKAQALIRGYEIIALSPWHSRHLGLAIDLGSTKLAGYLVDLSGGQTLAAAGLTNPQVSYGEDIISRMVLSLKSRAEVKRLQELAVEACNQLTTELCRQAKAEPKEIVDAVIAGNTAMHHLLLGLPVKQLISNPFISAVHQALDIKARDIALHIAPGAYVHLLPNIAGFVGGDHVAMLLATESEWSKGVVLALDIGTNTEVSLIDHGEITTVSCASGPAFEGGHIKDGMRAAHGAIERLRIVNSHIQLQTIGDVPPVGLCGSGILDALAQLYLAGVADKSGKMVGNHPRIRTNQNKKEFVLVSEEEREGNPAIVITQKDIRELQMAKAAIRAGIQILLDTKGRSEEEINLVIIAGAFGSYIDIENAVISGMLPSLPLNRFKQVGNAAGMGTKLALISSSKRARSQAIASQARYIELSSAPNFRDIFLQSSYLGRYRIVKGRKEEID